MGYYNVLHKSFGNVSQVMIPKVYQSTALNLAHSVCVDELKDILKNPNMKKLVKEYCSSCEICLCSKPSKHFPVPYLKYTKVSRHIERVHMDIRGLYLESEGFRYIFTVVNTLTKSYVAIPLKSKDSLEIGRAFTQTF